MQEVEETPLADVPAIESNPPELSYLRGHYVAIWFEPLLQTETK